MRNNLAKVRALIAIIIVLVLSLSSISILYPHYYGSDTTHPDDSIIIPLYSYPNSQWREIINLHKEYSNVPVYVIINPDNGPGNSYNETYNTWVNYFIESGIHVLGYVYTSYGNRSINTVMNQVSDYSYWYNIHSIFFDEVADNSSEINYYQTLVNESHTYGIKFTIGNPGTAVPDNYLNTFNVTVIYENNGYPEISYISQYSSDGFANRIAVIVYGVYYSQQDISDISRISYTDYFTSQDYPDPYENLSPYLKELFVSM